MSLLLSNDDSISIDGFDVYDLKLLLFFFTLCIYARVSAMSGSSVCVTRFLRSPIGFQEIDKKKTGTHTHIHTHTTRITLLFSETRRGLEFSNTMIYLKFKTVV